MNKSKNKAVIDWKENGMNTFYTIDDLPLNKFQKQAVLMWFARKLDQLRDESHCGKMYDPLVFETDTYVHSYAFDLHDGGRHHHIESLEHLETELMKELKKEIEAGFSIEMYEA